MSNIFMQRCFDLARLGAGTVSPNPMVGAVLVHEERIIGEGWHERYGEAHAEVNAVRSVKPEDRHLISESTLYVSLEPCCIFGRTPPCTDLILQHNIPKVILSVLDQTPEVAGKSVEILRAHGVKVVTDILEKEGKEISCYRNHFVTHDRPYIILKFAQTLNGKFGLSDNQYWISNTISKRLVHKWRSEMDAILVGTHTARTDNPELTNRLYFGKSPLRVVLDRNLSLPKHLHLFDNEQTTLVVTSDSQQAASRKPQAESNVDFLSINFDNNFLPNLLQKLHERRITTLLVEGGATLLQGFINQNLWDEARIIIGNKTLEGGIPAPQLSGKILDKQHLGDDQIIRYQNVHIR